MGTVTGKQLAKDIGQILTDAGFSNWSREDDIFPAITEALRVIIFIRPDANADSGNLTMVADKAIQNLPAGVLVLSSLTRNRGVSGSVSGPSITGVSRAVLDQTLPGWASRKTSERIRHYIYDLETPRLFTVFPIPTMDLQVEGIWGADPTPITNEDDVICIPDTFAPAIKEYALFRLHSMEAEGADINLAMSFQTSFFNLMGTKMSNQITALQMRKAGL